VTFSQIPSSLSLYPSVEFFSIPFSRVLTAPKPFYLYLFRAEEEIVLEPDSNAFKMNPIILGFCSSPAIIIIIIIMVLS